MRRRDSGYVHAVQRSKYHIDAEAVPVRSSPIVPTRCESSRCSCHWPDCFGVSACPRRISAVVKLVFLHPFVSGCRDAIWTPLQMQLSLAAISIRSHDVQVQDAIVARFHYLSVKNYHITRIVYLILLYSSMKNLQVKKLYQDYDRGSTEPQLH